MNYRSLNIDEIEQLQRQGCSAENWRSITVSEGFNADHITNVEFYGEVALGVFNEEVEIAPNVRRHSGIHNSAIGNYEIGNNCYLDKVGILQNTGEAQPECKLLSVLNEAGDGNLLAYNGLTSNIAALMVYAQKNHKDAYQNLYNLVRNEQLKLNASFGHIGRNTIIRDVKEIINCRIGDYCEITGAQRLTECSICGSGDANIFIGSGVIMEDCILSNGASVLNNALLSNCFIGEACTIINGFQAENSAFFANSYMSNGEACAAFCGPFTASHHKGSLLIGVSLSFYNAGSSTNYSNHAYKIGPVHYGTLERGSKTASGAHILHPAQVGAFTMCMNKITSHPNTLDMPFSYLFGEGHETWLVPGRNLLTLGTWRDVHKWPKRDKRQTSCRRSIINYSWLSPFTMVKIEKAISLLKHLQEEYGYDQAQYEYGNCIIRKSSLKKGIEAYKQTLLLFLYQNKEQVAIDNYDKDTISRWTDLGGMLLPQSELDNIIDNLAYNGYQTVADIETALKDINEQYDTFLQQYTLYLMDRYFSDIDNLDELCEEAHDNWLEAIQQDATKEFQMGDVEEDAYQDILKSIK